MYKIGIIGHGPERITDTASAKKAIYYTIDLLVNQYENDNLIFNIGSNIGVDHWAIDYCLERKIKYHLHLPAPVDRAAEHWYDEQQQALSTYFNHARSTTICSLESSKDTIFESDQNLIDHSNFLVCFWRGIKQGRTAEAIKYALYANKLTLNGLDDLKLVTKNDFVKRKARNGRVH